MNERDLLRAEYAAIGAVRTPGLPSELIVVAARRWCHARGLTHPTAPALHRLLAPLGLDMMAVSFDSLLCLFAAEAGRAITIGTLEQPTPDQIALCALLSGQHGAVKSAIEYAAASVLVLAAAPFHAPPS
jgi:hypothetical protein